MSTVPTATPFIRPPSRTIAPLSFTPSTMDFDHPPADPVPAARAWIEEALQLPTPNPNAAIVATVGAAGGPSLRTVLLRAFDASGAVFFTNYQSRKGSDLAQNPAAALLLHWDHLDRQLRIEGGTERTDEALNDRYFQERPRENQIGAWASDQSRPLHDRATFDARYAQFEQRFAGGPVPRPPHWGGVRIRLESIEFWQGHPARLHDRIIYRAVGDRWTVTRLYP